MRRDAALLDDIANSSRQIQQILVKADLAKILVDEILQAAILHHLAVIGEAAGRVSPELRERHSDIPWTQMSSQRNRVVHEYFGIDWQLVWKTIAEDLPVLRERIAAILRTEFPEDPIVS